MSWSSQRSGDRRLYLAEVKAGRHRSKARRSRDSRMSCRPKVHNQFMGESRSPTRRERHQCQTSSSHHLFGHRRSCAPGSHTGQRIVPRRHTPRGSNCRAPTTVAVKFGLKDVGRGYPVHRLETCHSPSRVCELLARALAGGDQRRHPPCAACGLVAMGRP